MILIILNDPPYASDRPYNALRLATSLAGGGEATVRMFLLGDGAWCGVAGQPVPEGRKDIEWMLRRFLAGGRRAAVCRTCMDDRGIPEAALVEGAYRSTLDELSAWTGEAEKVLVF